MIYLNRIKSNRYYKNPTIMSLEKKKQLFKGDCIISLGISERDTIELVNSNILSSTYYKSLYTPKVVTNIVNGKKVYNDLKSYYKSIQTSTNNNFIFKRTIREYKGKNLIYDASKELELYFKVTRQVGRNKLNEFSLAVSNLVDNVKNYKNIALYIPININGTVSPSYFSMKSLGKDNLQFMYQILKSEEIFQDFMSRLDDNVVIIFHDVKSNFIFKVDTRDNTFKRAKSFSLLKTLIKISSGEKEFTNEEKEIIKATASNDNTEVDEQETKKLKKATEVITSVKKALDIDTTKKLTSKEIDLLDKMTEKTVELINDENVNNNKSILNELEDSEDFKKYLAELKDIRKVGNSNETRIKELKEKQDKVDIKGLSIKDIFDDYKVTKIENIEIEQPNNIFDNVRKCTLKDFDDSYVQKEMNKDFAKVLSAFNEDKDIKLFVTDVKEEITSTDLTKKKTVEMSFQDENKVKHRVKVDMPIIKDGRYMYVNGSRKLIQKQILLKPIVKTAPDTVQVTTNYNKFFIKRFGRKLSENIEVFKKFLISEEANLYMKKDVGLKVKLGDCSAINSKYRNHIFYNEYSQFLLSIEDNNYFINFNYSEIENMLKTENNILYDKKLASIDYDKDRFQVIGYRKDKKALLMIDLKEGDIYEQNEKGTTTNIDSNLNLFVGDMFLTGLTEEGIARMHTITRPKTLTYTRIAINNKEIPLIIILGYENGLTNILERYDVKYVFTNSNKRPDILKDNTGKIKFANGYLYYDSSKIRNTLLFSGLSALATEQYPISEFDNKTPYLEYFNNAFGSRNTGKGIHNNLSLMIDPITKDVLEQLKLPTNIIDVLLYANTLLEDNTYDNLNDMNNYRIRGAEQVNAMLYKLLADSYRVYKDTKNNGNPIKMSLPQDILLKKLVELPTVDEHSTLNPSLEMEKVASATYKGLSGLNEDLAYTTQIRAYDDSMVGVFGYSSPDSDKVGVNVSAPTIKNPFNCWKLLRVLEATT